MEGYAASFPRTSPLNRPWLAPSTTFRYSSVISDITSSDSHIYLSIEWTGVVAIEIAQAPMPVYLPYSEIDR